LAVVPATRQTLLSLPFSLPEDELNRQYPDEILLFVALNGNPNWDFVSRTTPDAGRFVYRARVDGEYQFLIQAAFRAEDGTPYTRTLGRRQVLVDTRPPRVLLKGDRRAGGEVSVAWQVEDRSLADDSLKLTYRVGSDGHWQPVAIDRGGVMRTEQTESGRVKWWVGESDRTIEVRGEFTDRAGNLAVCHCQLESGTEDRAAPIQSVSRVGQSTPTRPSVIRSLEFDVEYDIEGIPPEAVRDVELWVTPDEGATWLHLASDPDRTSPVTARLQAEGRYGFRIVARADEGEATFAPASGTPPEFLVEIDVTPPDVRPTSARREEDGALRVTWEATDARMGGDPISLFFGPSPAGPWTELVTRHPNTGVFSCPSGPRTNEAVFLRIEATDEAGNVGSCVADHPIPFEIAPPTARIRSIRPLERATARSGQTPSHR
jgi:hypothetical protein